MKLSDKVKVAAGILVLLLLAAMLAWAWEQSQARSAFAVEQAQALREAAEERERAALATAENARQEAAGLRVELDSVKAREPEVKVVERVKVLYRNAPSVVKDYMASHKREIRWTNPDSSIKVRVPDALAGDSVEVELDTAKICKPFADALAKCAAKKEHPPLASPIRRGPAVEVMAGYGYSGLDVQMGTWPVEVGSGRFHVQAGVYGRASLSPLGEVMGNAAVGLRVTFK